MTSDWPSWLRVVSAAVATSAMSSGWMNARVPRPRPHAGVHVQRGELDHMPDPSGFRRERDRAISRIEIGTIAHEEGPVDAGQRGRQRRTRLFEVADVDIDLVAEKRPCLRRAAHENVRTLPTSDEAPGDSRSDVPGGAD